MKPLQVENIHLSYDEPGVRNRRLVIDGVSFTLSAGQIGCLVGPSGCGKTSVLRAIAGFEPLCGGAIRMGTVTLSSHRVNYPPERRNIGMMFQEVALFPQLTAMRNVEFGLWRLPRSRREGKALEWLQWVGLEGLEQRYPHELSGGQQQRVALARSMAPEPGLLLLDEPFSSLDDATRQFLRADLRSILKRSGQTALLVTHDEEEARAVADCVLRMADGRILDTRLRAEPEADTVQG